MPICMMQDPATFERCGAPATDHYRHPVVGKVVYHCDTHRPTDNRLGLVN